MKHPSEIERGAARLEVSRGSRCSLLALLALILLPLGLQAQDRGWTLAGSIGYAMLSLDKVDDDNSADVVGWNDQGIPVEPLGSVKRSPFFSARVRYRVNREFAFSLTGFYNSKKVSTSYESPAATLSLIRSVGSTDVSFGVAYFPSAQLYFLEWYIQVDMMLTLARASAEAYAAQTVKIDGEPHLMPTVETTGTYKKSKLSLGASFSADTYIVRPLFLRIEGGYRFAPVGKMEGDVVRFGNHTTETSSIEFDYSGVLFSVGIGITF